MSSIVIYESGTGFTKQYAQWIARELNCRAVSIKEMTESDITESDRVIFGGWIMGGSIAGYDKIRDKGIQKLVVFGVGASLDSEEMRRTIIETNHLGSTPFFYLPGGMRPDKLNFFVRLMLKQIKKSIAKKAEKTEQDRHMERVLCTNFDMSDKKYIGELVELVGQQVGQHQSGKNP